MPPSGPVTERYGSARGSCDTETAAVAALSALQALWGDLG